MSASQELKARIQSILTDGFGTLATVHVLDGHLDNVHVWVVSPEFDGVPEYIRQDRVWGVLDTALPASDKVKVSLILCFAPDEPEYQWAQREQDVASK